jgi:hypothetical protein
MYLRHWKLRKRLPFIKTENRVLKSFHSVCLSECRIKRLLITASIEQLSIGLMYWSFRILDFYTAYAWKAWENPIVGYLLFLFPFLVNFNNSDKYLCANPVHCIATATGSIHMVACNYIISWRAIFLISCGFRCASNIFRIKTYKSFLYSTSIAQKIDIATLFIFSYFRSRCVE